jgi:hypothetical protein
MHLVHLLSELEHNLQLEPQAEQAIPELNIKYHRNCIHLSKLSM